MKLLGYHTLELLLTPLQFGIPNSRLRYYLLARRTPFAIPRDSQPSSVWRHIPGKGADWIDPRSGPSEGAQNPVEPLQRFLSSGEWKDGTHPHAIPDRILEKWGRLFDIVLPSADRTCCFTRGQLVFPSRSVGPHVVRVHPTRRTRGIRNTREYRARRKYVAWSYPFSLLSRSCCRQPRRSMPSCLLRLKAIQTPSAYCTR